MCFVCFLNIKKYNIAEIEAINRYLKTLTEKRDYFAFFN